MKKRSKKGHAKAVGHGYGLETGGASFLSFYIACGLMNFDTQVR